MKHIFLNLTALSPLAIRADHAPGGASSAPYIAGTTLMGCLASVYRSAYPTQETDFEQLFLSGQIQFPNLYPASVKSDDKRKRSVQEDLQARDPFTLPVYPVPQTAQSCKRFPGFLNDHADDADDPPHGVRDSLLAWTVFELGDRASNALDALRDQKECKDKECKGAMHHFGGFYRYKDDKKSMLGTGVETRLQTHTGINRSTGTVQDGILYNREVFEEGACFSGVVRLPDALAQPFERFVRQVGDSGLVRIGTGRTRGLGKVQLDSRTLDEGQISQAAFRQRLEEFSRALHKLRRDQKPEPFYFALTLHAPAILRDSLLRYCGSIDEEMLEELLEMPPESLKRIYQAASVKRVTGWNEIWGTPRMNDYAIDTGSAFLFAYKAETGDGNGAGKAPERLVEALFKLEQEGLGERRAEGFGRVCISDQFHLEGIPS